MLSVQGPEPRCQVREPRCSPTTGASQRGCSRSRRTPRAGADAIGDPWLS